MLLADEDREFDRSIEGINDLIKAIEEYIGTVQDRIFSHLLIDGVAVYDDYWAYLEDNLDNIREIRLEFLTITEYIGELLMSTNDYLVRMIPAVETLADSFYQEVDAGVWKSLDDMLEGIAWLGNSFKIVDGLPNLDGIMPNYEKWNQYSKALQELQEVLPNMQESLELGDYVLVADIILYEVKPALENMQANIPALG